MKIQVNSIFKICIGISAIILSVAAFNFSVQSAHAAPPKPSEFIEEGTNKIGKYQMSISGVHATGDQITWLVIVMDTETGKSKTYYKQTGATYVPDFSTDGKDIW